MGGGGGGRVRVVGRCGVEGRGLCGACGMGAGGGLGGVALVCWLVLVVVGCGVYVTPLDKGTG